MHLDTHSFRERQRANTSLKCTNANNLQSGKRNAVPDPNVRLQRLKSPETLVIIVNLQVQFSSIFVTSYRLILFLLCAEDESEDIIFFSPYPSIFVHSCKLSRGDPDLIRMDGQTDRQTESTQTSQQHSSATVM